MVAAVDMTLSIICGPLYSFPASLPLRCPTRLAASPESITSIPLPHLISPSHSEASLRNSTAPVTWICSHYMVAGRQYEAALLASFEWRAQVHP